MTKFFVSQPQVINLNIYVKLYVEKNRQNRLVFATKSWNNGFIFLGGEVDPEKKQNFQTYL